MSATKIVPGASESGQAAGATKYKCPCGTTALSPGNVPACGACCISCHGYVGKDPTRCVCNTRGRPDAESLKCTKCGCLSHPECYANRGFDVTVPFICAHCVRPRYAEYLCLLCNAIETSISHAVRHSKDKHQLVDTARALGSWYVRQAPKDRDDDEDDDDECESFVVPDHAEVSTHASKSGSGSSSSSSSSSAPRKKRKRSSAVSTLDTTISFFAGGGTTGGKVMLKSKEVRIVQRKLRNGVTVREELTCTLDEFADLKAVVDHAEQVIRKFM